MLVNAHPVNESIQEINDNSWIIGGKILLSRRPSPPSGGSSWGDGKGSFYVISEAPYPLPTSRPLSAATDIEKVYDAGGASAVWSIGNAFCKVKILDPNVTREHVTLDYLHNKRPLSFETPDVYYYAEYDSRYYIVLSGITGYTLTKAWPNIDEATKQHYVSRVVNACKELAVWQAEYIGGVDGRQLSETYLTRLGQSEDFNPQNLLTNCHDLGMDCSLFVFFHCDLGPGNIIVNPANGSIGIIDWETAGFVPREWIRTKFRVSGGMDLPGSDQELRGDWRRRVQERLGEEGYTEIAQRWIVWWRSKG